MAHCEGAAAAGSDINAAAAAAVIERNTFRPMVFLLLLKLSFSTYPTKFLFPLFRFRLLGLGAECVRSFEDGHKGAVFDRSGARRLIPRIHGIMHDSRYNDDCQEESVAGDARLSAVRLSRYRGVRPRQAPLRPRPKCYT